MQHQAVKQAEAAHGAALAAYRKYEFKRAKGVIGRSKSPAEVAIDVILNALEAVRDDARRHYFESITRVEKASVADDRSGGKSVAARISRFKLMYIAEAEYSDELEIGVLFETVAESRQGSSPGPQPATYGLTVRSTPDGDNVYINEQGYGSTQVDVDLRPGDYTVRVEKAGYRTYTRTITLNAPYVVRARLKPTIYQIRENSPASPKVTIPKSKTIVERKSKLNTQPKKSYEIKYHKTIFGKIDYTRPIEISTKDYTITIIKQTPSEYQWNCLPTYPKSDKWRGSIWEGSISYHIVYGYGPSWSYKERNIKRIRFDAYGVVPSGPIRAEVKAMLEQCFSVG
ncbi:hypothetical protein NKDENANG_00502 [Candidatus Entotheonellaceae bacterium PAL068K]